MGGGVSGCIMAAAVLAKSSNLLMVLLVSSSMRSTWLSSWMVSMAFGILAAVANGGALGVICQYGLPHPSSSRAGSVVQLTASQADGAVALLVMSVRVRDEPDVAVVDEVWEGMVMQGDPTDPSAWFSFDLMSRAVAHNSLRICKVKYNLNNSEVHWGITPQPIGQQSTAT